jgi:hypothetical protein
LFLPAHIEVILDLSDNLPHWLSVPLFLLYSSSFRDLSTGQIEGLVGRVGGRSGKGVQEQIKSKQGKKEESNQIKSMSIM